MRQSKSHRFFDFTGGLNTKSPSTSLKPNEAMDLQNITLLPSGGFTQRFGNSVYNSSAMNSGANVQGTGYFRKSDNVTEWLLAFCGSKGFASDFDNVMDDITGAVTITAGANNIWTNFVMNDLSIWFGGALATDVPLKWDGTGNLAALAGSPPVASFGLTASNRAFAGNTVANPSRIFWSILGSPSDWTGAGSGSQDVSANDGDMLIGAAQLGVDHLICFKQNSIHDLVIRNAPFPLFPIRRGPNIGAISKRGIVSVGNMIYYVTPEPRMKAFDGVSIVDFPETIDVTWDGLNKSRLQYLEGKYYPRLNQIWWLCSNGSSSTNNYCIVWDISRKAWLRNPTGFKFNSVVLAQDRVAYGGSYAGKLYKLDDQATNSDASETSPGVIDCYWRTGWMTLAESMINRKSFPYVDLNFLNQTSGSFQFSYGFDFDVDRKTIQINQQIKGPLYDSAIYGTDKYAGTLDISSLNTTKGAGKFIQFLIRHANASEPFTFNGFEVPIKENAASTLR